MFTIDPLVEIEIYLPFPSHSLLSLIELLSEYTS